MCWLRAIRPWWWPVRPQPRRAGLPLPGDCAGSPPRCDRLRSARRRRPGGGGALRRHRRPGEQRCHRLHRGVGGAAGGRPPPAVRGQLLRHRRRDPLRHHQQGRAELVYDEVLRVDRRPGRGPRCTEVRQGRQHLRRSQRGREVETNGRHRSEHRRGRRIADQSNDAESSVRTGIAIDVASRVASPIATKYPYTSTTSCSAPPLPLQKSTASSDRTAGGSNSGRCHAA